MRRAVKTFARGAAAVAVQAIIWKDTKVCGFVTTAFVGYSAAASVLRSAKGSFKGLKVKAHDAIIAYLRCYGAVDRADRGIADFTISVKTRRWYMRVVFWVLDVVIWNIWVIVRIRVGGGGEGDEWYKQFDGSTGVPSGRYRFQLELADQLIAYALEQAVQEAGGDRTKVPWAPKPGGGRFTPAATPVEQAAAPPQSHELRPLKSTNTSTFCQACYKYKTCDKLSQGERRRQSKPAVGHCVACNWRFCLACHSGDGHKAKRLGSPPALNKT